MNKQKLFLIITGLIPPIMLLVFYNILPDTIPIHFDIHGNVDNYGSKNTFIFLSLITVFTTIFGIYIKPIMKGKTNENFSANLKILILTNIFFIVFFAYILFLSMNNQASMNNNFIYLIIAILFIAIGNYMPKLKQNPYFGIKIPFTYSTEENWHRTHRFAGKVWIISGFWLIVFALFLSKYMAFGLINFLVATIILPIVYSGYLYYRN